MSEIIRCDECGNEMSVSGALTQSIQEDLEKKMSRKAAKQEQALKEKEAELLKKEGQLKKAVEAQDTYLAKQLAVKLAEIESKNKDLVAKELQKERSLMDEERKSTKGQLDAALKNELEVRKKARELEQKAEHMELEVQRRLDTEKKLAAEKAVERMQEDYRLKSQEKEKQVENLLKTIDELKRKADAGSQQHQGETVEENTEAMLRDTFPLDEIEGVKKGQRGADILQRVKTPSGRVAGTVYWETKQTQTWQDGWLDKAREDMRAVRADIAIIATRALPKNAPSISQIDGVWVCNLNSIQGAAILIRAMILSVYQSKAADLGKSDHKESLYNYLTGPQFRQRMESIVHTYSSMKEDLDAEKRVLLKRFASREQQIEKILISSSEIYGDLQGIVGATTLPRISSLELDDLT